MEGSLNKWTNVVHGWQQRWFVLNVATSELIYYTSRDKMLKKNLRGRFQLKNAVLDIDDIDECKFTLICEGESKVFYFQAKSNSERMAWVRQIENVIKLGNQEEKEERSHPQLFNEIQLRISEGKSFLSTLREHMSYLKVCDQTESPNIISSVENILMGLNDIMLLLEHDVEKMGMIPYSTPETPIDEKSDEYFDCLEETFDEHQGIDEDLLYSPEGTNSSSNESVIKHLIRQVQIGMDLTRITLPTYILERRSLLEMLADFFSHCDLFSNITTFATPRERMVQMVRAYMSCFHAGRDADVAKKPYNPILGEIFRSHWPIGSGGTLNCGPVPWANEGDVILLAEQVSHHPPVSAFYAENRQNKFSMAGQIWTKSKFLGLSVCVQMVGTTVITLGEHGETYTLSFPCAYGRSILTVPWFEFGGKVDLTASTGYSAHVEFHTKPAYKSTKHQISAQIFAPGEAHQFCSIKGAWNGVLTANFGEENEIFFDCSSAAVIKKVVRPIRSQEPNESRRLWYDVTTCLFNSNVSGATSHKHELEEKQRGDKRYREQNNITYKPKYFELVDDTWRYIHVE